MMFVLTRCCLIASSTAMFSYYFVLVGLHALQHWTVTNSIQLQRDATNPFLNAAVDSSSN